MTFSFNHLGNLGHLGNQMFQYAATKSFSVKHNRDFIIAPKEVYGKYYYTTLRSNIDDCFNIKCDRGITNFITFQEKQFHFDYEMFENPPSHDVDLYGFFQSDKWFKHIDNEIKKDFSFKPEIYDMASELKDSFDSKELISIHIRRTDFVTNNNHITQDINYYYEALKLFPEDCQVLIFSDDSDWCKQQEIFSSDRFLISNTNNPYIDLCLISLCDYIVIANSTYSWWGAYLSDAKKIIAPSLWYPDTNPINTVDIYCKNWIKI